MCAGGVNVAAAQTLGHVAKDDVKPRHSEHTGAALERMGCTKCRLGIAAVKRSAQTAETAVGNED